MKDIIIYGAGGFGRETRLLLDQINKQSAKWNVLGFCDDGKQVRGEVDRVTVLGGINYLKEFKNKVAVVLAIADPIIRQRIRTQLTNTALDFPSLVHPSVTVNESCSVGEGSILCADVVMTVNVKINSFAIVNLKCTLGHDCVIDDYASLMPSVNISGNVSVGKGVYVGAGAILLQGISIGENSVIGAGAVVNKSFEKDKRIVGLPAKAI